MSFSLLTVLDLVGTFFFALSGAIKAVNLKLDFLGVIVYGITVGCVGGMIRDLLLGITPVTAFTSPYYVFISIGAGILAFFISPKAIGKWTLIPYIDAIGLGIFTAIGCSKAHSMGVGSIGLMISGVLTAVGGGILRDVFSHETPMVFASDFYASASILGALCYLIMIKLNVAESIVLWVSAFVVIILRILGYKFKWRLPVAKMANE